MARSNLVQRDEYDATFPPVSSRAPRMNRMKCWLGCSWSQISTKVNYSASTFEAELQAGTKMAFYVGVVPKTLKVVTVCSLPLSLA